MLTTTSKQSAMDLRIWHKPSRTRQLHILRNNSKFKVQVLKDVLSSKCDWVPELKKALIDSKQNKLIVEVVPWDFFWSSGLSKMDALHTKTKFWFDKNQIVVLLTELRDCIEGFQVQKKTTTNNKKQGTQSHKRKSSVLDSSESE